MDKAGPSNKAGSGDLGLEPGTTINVRTLRQNLADIVKMVKASGIPVGISTLNEETGGLVPNKDLRFLQAIRAAKSPDELSAALAEHLPNIAAREHIAGLNLIIKSGRKQLKELFLPGVKLLAILPEYEAVKNKSGSIKTVEFGDENTAGMISLSESGAVQCRIEFQNPPTQKVTIHLQKRDELGFVELELTTNDQLNYVFSGRTAEPVTLEDAAARF